MDIRDWRQAFAFQRNGDYDRAIQGYRALLAGHPSTTTPAPSASTWAKPPAE